MKDMAALKQQDTTYELVLLKQHSKKHQTNLVDDNTCGLS